MTKDLSGASSALQLPDQSGDEGRMEQPDVSSTRVFQSSKPKAESDNLVDVDPLGRANSGDVIRKSPLQTNFDQNEHQSD